MQIKIALALLTLSFLTLPAAASGHSLGVSLEATDGAYFIDIGYDPLVLTDTDNAIFDIALRDAETKDIARFDHAWVRILKGRETVLASGIAKQEFGPTTLMYRFPGAGEYTLEVSYRGAEGDAFADAKFPLSVQEGGSGAMRIILLVGGGAIALGVFCIAWYLLIRRRSASHV